MNFWGKQPEYIDITGSIQEQEEMFLENVDRFKTLVSIVKPIILKYRDELQSVNYATEWRKSDVWVVINSSSKALPLGLLCDLSKSNCLYCRESATYYDGKESKAYISIGLKKT